MRGFCLRSRRYASFRFVHACCFHMSYVLCLSLSRIVTIAEYQWNVSDHGNGTKRTLSSSQLQPFLQSNHHASNGCHSHPDSRPARGNASRPADNASQGKHHSLASVQYTRTLTTHLFTQLDAISDNNKVTTPLEPKPISSHSRSSSLDSTPASPPRSQSLKPALSSATPQVEAPLVKPTDKEREKLLYPGRVNLTSESFPSGAATEFNGNAGHDACSDHPVLTPPVRISTADAKIPIQPTQTKWASHLTRSAGAPRTPARAAP